MLMGINVRHVDMFTFGLGTACAGLAGSLLAPMFPVFPTIGVNLELSALVVVVVGGLGSIGGALIGCLSIGLIETQSGFFIGRDAADRLFRRVPVGAAAAPRRFVRPARLREAGGVIDVAV